MRPENPTEKLSKFTNLNKLGNRLLFLKMALLVDRYRPRSLDALTFHTDLSKRLRALVREPFGPKQSRNN